MKLRLFLIAAVSVMLTGTANAQRRSNPGLDSLRNEKDPLILKKKLIALGEGSETDMRLVLMYYNVTEDAAKADSVLQLILGRYPNGEIAFIQAQNALFVEPSANKQEELFNRIRQKFPDKNLDQAYYSVANAYAESRNINKAMDYIKQIKDPTFRAAATRIVAGSILKYDLSAAEAMLKTEIDQLVKAGVPPEEGMVGPRGDARPSYFAFMELYGNVLLKSGKYVEALIYTKEAYEGSKRKSDELIGNYGFLLSKTSQHQQALPLLEKLITEGKANLSLKQAFKESYISLNPGKDGTTHLANLERGVRAKIEAEVAKMLISEKSPDFVIKDMTGRAVSLADFKGKIIVLDFWATWCGPCKKSFPAMQMAVDKYKSDSNVKFLFIHTWEKVANPLADAKSYLSSNNYKFDLYMDTKDVKTKNNPAVTAFGVKGIPAKFVIDGNGNIRFKMTGFSGGNDAAVAELSAMIDLLKKS